MRDIKFRAWDKRNKQMVEVKAIDWCDTDIISINYPHGKLYSAPEEFGGTIKLMQYTGLKDKNGKEIYEGDIIKWYNNLARIEWREELAQFNAHRFVEPVPLYRQKIDSYNWMDAEVIGNIYENPELLETKWKHI